jgi:hypothetical protein
MKIGHNNKTSSFTRINPCSTFDCLSSLKIEKLQMFLMVHMLKLFMSCKLKFHWFFSIKTIG